MQRQPKDKDAICQSTHSEGRIFRVDNEGTPLKQVASFLKFFTCDFAGSSRRLRWALDLDRSSFMGEWALDDRRVL
jgi:hypothetical protein